jgi:transcriptional regulator with XRE-family HTH domain
MGKTLAERFKEARQAAGMSPADMARALRVKPSSISNIESGKTQSLKAQTAAGVERVTGYSAVWVATGHGPKMGRMGKMPTEEQAQIDALYEAIMELPPALRAKVEADVEFLRGLQKQQDTE